MQVSPSVPMHSQPSSINVVQISNPRGNQQSNEKKKGRDRKKIKMGRVMQINPIIILGRLKMSLKI